MRTSGKPVFYLLDINVGITSLGRNRDINLCCQIYGPQFLKLLIVPRQSLTETYTSAIPLKSSCLLPHGSIPSLAHLQIDNPDDGLVGRWIFE